jgi:hypothetical protein
MGAQLPVPMGDDHVDLDAIDDEIYLDDLGDDEAMSSAGPEARDKWELRLAAKLRQC